ncbi:MAG: ceramide glucosyltransferase [Hyphomicrobium sp.]|jgi:ceramide glucosyltransferase|nr:ceramide glucosyltransferase [Hyphomicrobium sp.]
MDWIALVLMIFAGLVTALHLVTASISIIKVRKPPRTKPGVVGSADQGVTIIRPVCGVDPFEEMTLRSTFELTCPRVEIIFCCAREQDPVVPLIRSLIAAYPGVPARLLIGDDRICANPKLNNLLKGWKAAATPWVIMADSNVLMPNTYVEEMLGCAERGIGLVCSPPVGSQPRGFSAELECAFLNTYQARWQLSADAAGFGFAQGKSMLWRKDDLDAAGGIGALALEIAEDAAATKIVRGRGQRVRLVDRPFSQPLGSRTARQVWDRQVRWARLRRATFLPFYIPELFAGSVFPVLASAGAAALLGEDPLIAGAAVLALWLAAEAVLAHSAGWHMSWWSPAAWLVRDLALPVIWLQGLAGSSFTWRGNEMTVAQPAP